ncbi:MAG: DUF423 domain-containing protein [Nitrospirota bacterium]|nr:DUF423 domain-containing protein [Nitrospirota bacterium]MDE3118682.1 DUF423 domain-containing protein [Nitrospirota bacterium]MDE3241157.1 DUF423 domain-containing protein [Nitrospirota bacterium]
MAHPSHFLPAGAVLAGLGVAAGAFGAHGLKALLSVEMLAVFETAVRYQVYHALALMLTGILLDRSVASEGRTSLRLAGRLFLAGVLLFSGSLYLLALSQIRWLGAITPIGGFCFIAGWGVLAWAANRKNRRLNGIDDC